MKKITKQCLPELLDKMAAAYQVYAPLENGGEVNFARWSAGAQPDLVTLKTAVPAKRAGGLIVKEESLEETTAKLASLLSEAHVI